MQNKRLVSKRKLSLLTIIFSAIGLLLSFASPAQADANWSSLRYGWDKDNHVELEIWWKVDLNDPDEGFKLERVTITAEKHDATFYDHIDGHGLSAWNDRSVIKWQKDGSQTNLYPSDTNPDWKSWDTAVIMSTSHTLTVGFAFNVVSATGGAGVNGCTKIKIERGNPNPIAGFCG